MAGPSKLIPSDSLFPVLDLLRSAGSSTRSELAGRTGLTRKVVTQRVDELLAAGFVEEGELGRSTGGRMPREVRFRTEHAHVLVAELAATSITVGLADLGGTVLTELREDADPAAGPEATLGRVEEMFDKLLAARQVDDPAVFGIGIGVPGPVAIGDGRPIGALSVPEWADHPVRDRLADRYDLPVWVDNDANLMALGELRAGLARGHRDVLFVKVGRGIGGAVIADGRLRRGTHGFAGEFGHAVVSTDVDERCWCGRTGCLTQVAGIRAIGREGRRAAGDRSAVLAAIAAQGRTIGAREVFAAAAAGDPVSTGILTRAGAELGAACAVLVSALNPSLVLVDGGPITGDDPFMTAFRATTLERTLPAAAQHLRFALSPRGNSAGLAGAAFVVLDDLFAPGLLRKWAPHGTPAGRAGLLHGEVAELHR
jgi:glucokinase-like ROK family protein